jgi:hypothetical protein
MESSRNLDPLPRKGAITRPKRTIRVHTLSEYVFCSRAGVLARESNAADQCEDDPPNGPRLDGFHDYDEHRFCEEIQAAWGQMRLWLTWLAPSLLLTSVIWRAYSPLAAIISSLPVFYLAARIFDTTRVLFSLVRERAAFRAAPAIEVDLAPQQIAEVNWWTLRKFGFDCAKPNDSYSDGAIAGRPWRLLIKDTMWRSPVIRKHRGERVWGHQHVIRAAAYCRLVEALEGGQAPFGVLMFAGSYQCWVFPNTPEVQAQLNQTIQELNEFLDVYDRGGFIPAEPTDERCCGCPWGKPIGFHETTILNGQELPPIRIEGISKGDYHCACGDKFNWVPPHEDTERLQGKQA